MRRIQQLKFERAPAGRRIKVSQHDTLDICGYLVDAEILAAVLCPDNRMLWAFISDGKGRVEPVAVDEEHCIWLQDSDLIRGAKDDPQDVGAVKRRRQAKR